MVCFQFHTSVLINQHIEMAKSVNSTDPSLKLKQMNQSHKNKRIPACDQYPYAIIDVIISIAVLGAIGFLLYPSASVVVHKIVELGEEVLELITEEIISAPMVFGCLGLGILCLSMALLAMVVCTENRCEKSGCRGLRNAAEFDIRLETEESEKKSRNESDEGLFEYHHRELEAKLKKIAPPNGKAVMVFKARCGCSVGRMEVQGPKKYRKVKN